MVVGLRFGGNVAEFFCGSFSPKVKDAVLLAPLHTHTHTHTHTLCIHTHIHTHAGALAQAQRHRE